MQLVLVFLSLFVCCTFCQISALANFKLAGNALVNFNNFKAATSVAGSVSVDAAVSAKVAAIKAALATDTTAHAFLVTALNAKVTDLVSAFTAANVAARAQIDEAAQFAATIGASKSLAIDASADVVASAAVVLDKVQARAAILLRLQATAGVEIDLVNKQLFALLAQEIQAFVVGQTGAAFVALGAKITAGTVVAADITTEIVAAFAAKVELVDLIAQVKAHADVLVDLKAKLVDLPRALVVDAALKAKATAVTSVEAAADIKVKARDFFAAKACRTVHFFRDLIVVFGAQADAAVRVTLVSRLRDLLTDELSVELAGVSDIVITPIKASASIELSVSFSAAVNVNVTALQAKVRALVLAFIHAHCHPFKIDVKSLTATGITVNIAASAQVNGDPATATITTDNVQATAQAKFRADVAAEVAAGVDADFKAILKLQAGVIGGIIAGMDATITAVQNVIAEIDANVRAALTATVEAFARVKLNLFDAAVVNFKTEAFALADVQARVKIAAAQVKEAYAVLLLRVKQDLQELNVTGQLVVRLEANLRKQLLQALADRNGVFGAGVLVCPALNTFSVEADFNETDIEVLIKSNAKCVEYGAIFAKILSLKRQLLQAIVAKKAHVALEASVKTQVDVVAAKHVELKAKVEAQIAAGFEVKKSATALVGVWVDAAVQYKACLKGCLGVLGRGNFGASIEVDVQATAAATYKHTATATSIDLAASAKVDVEVELAASLQSCVALCTGGDGSYCKEKSKVEPTKKRQSGSSASASQVTTTDSVGGPSSSATSVVLSTLVVFGVIAHYFM